MAWFNDSWSRRLPVTIDNTANAISALSYYQAAVSLTGAAYTSFHAVAKSDGGDVRVMDSDGTTPLNFALEGIDTANGAVYLLVKVPYVAAGATRTIYVHYGNPAATSVSSYATTVGPTTALIGPTDVYAQADTANFNANPVAVILKNQGGIHGGGAGLNGKILAFIMAGANSNGDRTNGSIATLSSTDGGVTWGGKSIILAHNGTNMAEPRSVVELADGTILLVYSTDTFTISSTGKARMYVARSTDGGTTWTNLNISPSNPVSVPWIYGTNVGEPYGRVIEKTPGGDLFLPVYGSLTGDTGFRSWLLKCASGSDPTNGANWVTQGTIAYDASHSWGEATVIQTVDSTHLLAIMRDTVSAGLGDLWSCSSADSGATWTTPAQLNLPGVSYQALGAAVSPELIKLASGNYLLCWGVRYGSDYGATAAAISTDGGATWLDRAPFVTTTGNNSALWDGGYPTTVQNADGTICVLAYRNLGNINFCNVFRMVFTEDYVCNCNHIYESCESFDSLFSSHGANATISATHAHSGSGAVKIDNSTGTGGLNDYVVISAWSANTAKQTAKVAYSYWGYEAANDTFRGSRISASATLGVGNRVNEEVNSALGDHFGWYNGSTHQDTGVVVPANQWNKHTLKADVEASTVTGQLLLNNVSATTSLGQYATGSPPLTIQMQGGSVASTHNVIFWADDLYTHQYTANIPAVSALSEESAPSGVGSKVILESGGLLLLEDGTSGLREETASTATSYTITPPSPSSGYANNVSGNFTVTPDAAYTGTVTLTLSGGGLSTPIVLTWIASSTPTTFTLTPPAAGLVTLTPVSSPSLTDPAPATYTANAQTLSVGPLTLTALTPQTVNFQGGGTAWSHIAPTFSVSGPGAAGMTIGPVTVTSDTACAALVTPGATAGSITFTDGTTGATASAMVASAPVSAATGWSYLSSVSTFGPGLVGEVGYTVLHSDGSVQAARSMVGVFAVGSAGYAAPVPLPIAGSFVILWDDSFGHAAFEAVSPRGCEPPSEARPSGLTVEQAIAGMHAVLAGLSRGFVRDAISSVTYLATDGISPRVSGTEDATGNRTGIVLTPPQ